jgi:DNA polymerase-3 subunit beta
MSTAKVTLERAALLGALKQMGQVVEARNTIPILSHVLLEAGSDGLRLTASNLDQLVCVRVPAVVAGAASLCVPHAGLASFCASSLPGAEIALTLDTEKMRGGASHGRTRWQSPALPSEDFPVMQGVAGKARRHAPPPLLAQAINRAAYAASTEETRYYLNGVHLKFIPAAGDTDAALDVVATDGHRLVRTRLPLDHEQAGVLATANAIVPRQALGPLCTLLALGSAQMELSENNLLVEAGETLYITKLIDGTFPEYSRVIPAHLNSDTRIELRVDQLRHALKAAESVREGKANILHIALGTGEIELSNDHGEAAFNAEVEAAVSIGASGDKAFGLNSKYLLAALDHMPDDGNLIFLGAGAATPWLIVDPASPNVTTVIMPARTGGGRASV